MSESKGRMVDMTSADEHGYQAYHVHASGDRGRRGGIVVIQEIFGVNSHIRQVADGYAENGYEVYAPALFDRIERGVELGYDEDDLARGLDLMRKMDITNAVLDVQNCVATMRGEGPVGLVGYCWGGTVSWVTACRAIGVAGAVCYYGGNIIGHVDLSPKCPVMMHFGEQDAAIPMDAVDTIRAKHANADIHVYDADHGFNCDQRASYNEAAASAALERSLEFFHQNVG